MGVLFATNGLIRGGGSDNVLFEAEFGGPDRLLTNEFAVRHPASSEAVKTSQWFVTSGSLFVRGGAATNGRLDDLTADPRSVAGTNSAVFRAYTKQHFQPNYQVLFEVRVEPPRNVAGLEAAPWDGLHLMLDAESPEAAYYVSLYRRNGQAVIKKKTPGGAVAGGSYVALSRYVSSHLHSGEWSEVRVDVRRAGPRAVTIDLYENGILLATATDDSAVSESAPFTGGRVGIRADKTSFAIKELTINAL
ncbi:MAG: hypothetical protein QOF06_1977 [Solirubrobacterales bacterium]|nr:hypothetical protein [Solirubrobacterales bacterium]